MKKWIHITDTVAKGILKDAYLISEDGEIYSNISNKVMKGTINSDNYTVYNLKMMIHREN